MQGVDTNKPSEARKLFEQVITDIKATHVVPNVNMNDVTDSHWNDNMKLSGDDARRDAVLGNLQLAASTVNLKPFIVHRSNEMYTVATVAKMRKRGYTAAIDYVFCHIGGYNKYVLGKSGMPVYIKGRDIIFSGTYLSVKEIIDMMKDEIEAILTEP